MSAGFHGVYPVLYAFFDQTGELDEDAMSRQVEHCIEAGCHGICVLGLVTEVNKMDSATRLALVRMVGRQIAGRVPYAVTVSEATAQEQIDFCEESAKAGADWVILQPPPGPRAEEELLAFFGRVADGVSLPVAIQNNPVNLASSLSVDAMLRLFATRPNIQLAKAEGWSVEIERLSSESDGRIATFGGHGGLEFLSLMRGGGAGLIPAPDAVALQVRIYELMNDGSPAAQDAAERIHVELLPLIIFMTRNIQGLVYYGKRLMARRLSLGMVHDLAPVHAPTAFGLAEMERLYDRLVQLELELGTRPAAA